MATFKKCGVVKIGAIVAAVATFSFAPIGETLAVVGGVSSGGGGGGGIAAGSFIQPVIPLSFQLPQRFQESMEDLSVKVQGGRVVVQRIYDQGRWKPNFAWADLILTKPAPFISGSTGAFTVSSSGGSAGGNSNSASVFVPQPLPGSGGGVVFDPDGNAPEHARGLISITRMANVYQNQRNGVFTYMKRDVILATDSGFRWQDREGRSADYDKDGRIVSYKDRNDVTVSFAHDSENRITGVFDALGRQVLWLEYLHDDLVSAIRDATNRRVSYQYTDFSLTAVVDARGNSWFYEYNSSLPHNPVSRTDPEGRKMSLGGCYGWVWETTDQDGVGSTYKCNFDATKKQFYLQAKTAGGLVAEAWFSDDGLGLRRDINGKTIVTLSTNGRTRTSIDRNGGRTVNVYDEFDNLLSRTHADGSSVSYSYDPIFSNVTRKVDANGAITDNEYGSKGNLIRKTEAVGLPEQRVTTYAYDSFGNRTSATRLGDDRTQEATYAFAYDDSGNVRTLTTPEGSVVHYTYDVMGNVVSITDPRGEVWAFTYDANGQLLTEADPLGNTKTYAYDKVGDKIKEIDANNNATTFVFDRQHRLTSTTDALGKTTAYEYSIDGQITKEADAENKVRTYQYDLGMRLFKAIDGNGNITGGTFADDGIQGHGSFFDAVKINWPTFEQQFKYDKRNRVSLNTALLGSEGLSTGYDYDSRGNIVKVTDANGKSWFYEYDAFDNVAKETDPQGHTTRFEYDNRENVTRIVDANNNASRFVFDRSDRLLQEIRALGQTTQYVYDANDSVIDRVDPKGQKTQYAYDNASRLVGIQYFLSTNATAADQTISLGYDGVGNLTSWNDGTFSGSFAYDEVLRKVRETVSYGAFTLGDQYRFFGNDTISGFTGPDGVAYTYRYDGENQLAGIQLPDGTLTVNEYQWTAPKKVTLPGGTTQQYEYNGLLNLQSLQAKGPTQNPVLNLNNTYNRVQTVAQKSIDSSAVNYTYDDNTWLTKVQSPAGELDFTLDGLGNRIADANGVWTYDANDELLSRPGVVYQYDDNGNLISKTQGGATTKYFYDVANRLARVEDQTGNTIARYGYDPFDHRLYKEVAGTRTYFFHTDQGMVAEVDSSGAPVRSIGYHPQSMSGIQPLFVKDGAGYSYYHLDHLGTPIALTDSTGRVVWSADYDAFGHASIRVADVVNNLRYPGQYFDNETGLHYNNRRYYDPDTGRYLTEDPIGLDGGLNRYLYADADSINNTDPTGECLLAGAIGGAISGALWSIFDQVLGKGCFAAISWKDVAKDAAIGAGIGAATCGLSKILGPKVPCNSFSGDTLIHTKNGLVPIRNLKKGDEVLSSAEWDGSQSFQKIENVISHDDDEDLVVVTLADGERIEATQGHPLHVVSQGWKDASRLQIGDMLDLRDQRQIQVVNLDHSARHERLYNLTVANTHTYFIGKDGTLVHNGSCGSGKPPIARRVTLSTKKEAYEAAKQAGGGRPPVNHAHGHPGRPTPHYHPDVPIPKDWTPHGANPHDHYFYPKARKP